MKKETASGSCDSQALLLYYYGELDGTQRKSLERHLQGCSGCAREWQRLQQDLEGLEPPTLKLDAVAARRFAARVTERTSRRERRAPWLCGAAATAGVILFLVLLLPPGMPLEESGRATTNLAMVQDMELLQYLDLLRDLELLQGAEGQG